MTNAARALLLINLKKIGPLGKQEGTIHVKTFYTVQSIALDHIYRDKYCTMHIASFTQVIIIFAGPKNIAAVRSSET